MSRELGSYHLLKRLAVGGMAEIWLARQQGVHGFEKLVVIKRILPHLAAHEEFVQMFLDEARLASQLRHQHIVQIFDLGAVGSSYYIAMEYIHGENLRVMGRRLARQGDGRLSPAYAAKVISQASEALHYAHVKKDVSGQPLNIIHRDVSPQNLLVGYDGNLKVVDFGIAKAASQFGETRTGVLKGKYAYMSPEQCRGEKLDARSDIFALGVVLWELVTGRRLYHRNSDLMTLKAISEEPTPAPSSTDADVPEALESIILKALSKDRDDRYTDASELHQALEVYLGQAGEVVTSRKMSEFMEGLFPDRLAAWKELLESAEDSEFEGEFFDDNSDLFETATPSSSASGLGAVIDAPTSVRGAGQPRSSGEAPNVSAGAGTPEAQQRRPAWLPLALVGLLVVLAGVGGAFAFRALQPEGEEPSALAPAPTVLAVTTTPPGATVRVDGVVLEGVTPLRAELSPTGMQAKVEVVLEGHEPRERGLQLHPGRHHSWDLVLPERADVPSEPVASDAPTAEGAAGDAAVDAAAAVEGAPDDAAGDAAADAEGDATGEAMADVTADAAGDAAAAALIDAAAEASDVDDEGEGEGEPLDPDAAEAAIAAAAAAMNDPSASASTGDTGPSPAEAAVEAAPAAEPGADSDETPAAAPRRRPRKPGYLTLDARPWCRITLDGTDRGVTPLARVEVRPGRHQVRCAHPEHGTKNLTVTVRSGKEVRRIISLGQGELRLLVRPWANVLLDGKPVGQTPFPPLELAAGRHELVLENAELAYKKRMSVIIEPGKTRTVRIDIPQ